MECYHPIYIPRSHLVLFRLFCIASCNWWLKSVLSLIGVLDSASCSLLDSFPLSDWVLFPRDSPYSFLSGVHPSCWVMIHKIMLHWAFDTWTSRSLTSHVIFILTLWLSDLEYYVPVNKEASLFYILLYAQSDELNGFPVTSRKFMRCPSNSH